MEIIESSSEKRFPRRRSIRATHNFVNPKKSFEGPEEGGEPKRGEAGARPTERERNSSFETWCNLPATCSLSEFSWETGTPEICTDIPSAPHSFAIRQLPYATAGDFSASSIRASPLPEKIKGGDGDGKMRDRPHTQGLRLRTFAYARKAAKSAAVANRPFFYRLSNRRKARFSTPTARVGIQTLGNLRGGDGKPSRRIALDRESTLFLFPLTWDLAKNRGSPAAERACRMTGRGRVHGTLQGVPRLHLSTFAKVAVARAFTAGKPCLRESFLPTMSRTVNADAFTRHQYELGRTVYKLMCRDCGLGQTSSRSRRTAVLLALLRPP